MASRGRPLAAQCGPSPLPADAHTLPSPSQGLFEQFRRVANLYFLAVACLSLTPFTPVTYWSTWAPLLLVIGISMVKEALEDYKRFKQDTEQNNSPVDVVDGVTGERNTLAWKDVKVGDIVVVLRDEFFPADLLFLSSSNSEGTCYVETKNLDGETNLKLKKCVEATTGMGDAARFAGWRATLECDAPNNSLYTFNGTLVLTGGAGADDEAPHDKVSIGPANVLLRGSNLRNTEWVMGVAVYGGHDTKVMMNAMKAPSKRSGIERRLDSIVALMLFLLFLMCLAGSVYMAQRTKKDGPKMWYLAPFDSTYYNLSYNANKTNVIGLYAAVTQFILYGYLIPISLYVSIEMVKVAQSMYFINNDTKMYHTASDTPAQARTSNLNEELGQVVTILSDKTGTLTQNSMEFFKCTIGGVKYGAGVTDIERSIAARSGNPLPPPKPEEAGPLEKGYNFRDVRLVDGDTLTWRSMPAAQSAAVRAFYLLLATCHTVIPEGEPTPEAIKYQAESPDEAAFVVAAKRLGFFFKARNTKGVTVVEAAPGSAPGAPPVERFYEVLNVLEFNSTRKRMSVVVRDPEGKLMLFTKGADSVIYERLSQAPGVNVHRDVTAQHMDEFAQAGLRTLCLAYAPVDEKFYAAWNAQFYTAKTSLVDRDAKLDAVAELIEKDLLLLGATAIEDKLQDGVPQTIEHLASAGVALWVLTGDKQDTAINIGMACNLLRVGMAQHIISLEQLVAEAGGRTNDKGLRERAAASVREQLGDCLAKVVAEQASGSGVESSLIIDGFGLTFALSPELSDLFWQLSSLCEAVICCRVSPLQKALVTGLVKSKGQVTLAIGDGANDVGMIQAAHIGVGISGQEGMQAVMASDFAIAQFRYLERLVLVHGRYNYKRNARLVTYFFYKNMYFGFTIFWFNAFAFFSGQKVYNDWAMSSFNIFFTSLPILVVAILDQDVSAPVSHHFPKLYAQGQRNDYIRWPVILYWAGNGFYQSICTFLAVFWGQYRLHADRKSGQMMELDAAGSAMYTIVVIVVTLQLALAINYFTWLHHALFWFSVFLKYLFIIVLGGLKPSFSTNAYGVFTYIMAPTPSYWLTVAVCVVIALLPDFTIRAYKRIVFPDDHQIIQEAANIYGHNPPPKSWHQTESFASLTELAAPGQGGAGGAAAPEQGGDDAPPTGWSRPSVQAAYSAPAAAHDAAVHVAAEHARDVGQQAVHNLESATGKIRKVLDEDPATADYR